MRAGAGGLARGLRPDGQHGVDVAGRDRVVHQPRALGALLHAQRLDHGPVEQPHAGHREAALDRAARQLVAEPEPVGAILDHARELRGGQGAELVAQQRAASSGGTCEGTTDRRSSASRQSASSPRSRASTASLTLAGHLVARRRERLGDEERVAARERVHGGRDRAPLPAASDCTAAGDSGASSMRCTGQPGERAEQAVQRMARIELVAHRSGPGRRRRCRCAAPRSRARRGWRRRPSGRPRRRGRWGAARRAPPGARRRRVHRAVLGQRGRQRTVAARRRVAQRTERARGDEVVARRHEDARLAPPTRAANARTRLVLPMPASPAISAVEPRPFPASATAPTRTSSCASRSSRTSAITTW